VSKKPTKISLTTAAVALGRKGGKVKSEAKAKAARKNARRRWALYAAAKMTEGK